MKPHEIRLVCLDIDGTLTDGVGGPAIPGTVEAVLEIRRRIPVRLVTNTTSLPHRALADGLIRQRFLDEPAALVMVGDDAEFDVSASVALGMAGVLVRTGKFRPDDAIRFTPPPSAVLESVAELPAWLGIGEEPLLIAHD